MTQKSKVLNKEEYFEMFNQFKAEVIQALRTTNTPQAFRKLFGKFNQQGEYCYCAEGVILKDVLNYQLVINDSDAPALIGSFGRYASLIIAPKRYEEMRRKYASGDSIAYLLFEIKAEDLSPKARDAIVKHDGSISSRNYNIINLNDTYKMSFSDIADCIESGWKPEENFDRYAEYYGEIEYD